MGLSCYNFTTVLYPLHSCFHLGQSLEFSLEGNNICDFGEQGWVICPRDFMTWSSVQHMDKFSLCVCVCVRVYVRVCAHVRALELYLIITALNWGTVLNIWRLTTTIVVVPHR